MAAAFVRPCGRVPDSHPKWRAQRSCCPGARSLSRTHCCGPGVAASARRRAATLPFSLRPEGARQLPGTSSPWQPGPLLPLSFSFSSAQRAPDSCQGLQVPGSRPDHFLFPYSSPSARRAHDSCQGLQVPGARTDYSLLFFLLRPEGGRSSLEHLVLVELNLVPPQQFQKLAPEVLLLMVLFLTGDLRGDGGHEGLADRESAITLLPGEMPEPREGLVDPLRGASLDLLEHLGMRQVAAVTHQ
jgi:hypothetical protein